MYWRGVMSTVDRIDSEYLYGLARDKSVAGRMALAETISDLFLQRGAILTERERTLMFSILRQMIHDAEMSVRRVVSAQLAERDDAPRDLVQRLANDEIEVAYPILTKSTVLHDTDLIEVIQQRTLEHQMAIAIRQSVSEAVSGALVQTGNENVIGTLLENFNAKISDATMEYLVDEAKLVDTFQEPVLRRHDLDPRLAKRKQRLRDGWGGRSAHLIRRLFPHRHLFFRTKGRVSYIRISRWAQIALVVVLVLAGGWSAFTSVGFVLHNKVLADRDNALGNARLAYQSLLGEVVAYQRKFTSITLDLEENRAMMLNLGTVEVDLQTALAERNQALFEGNRMRRHIKDLETRLGDLQEAELKSVQRLTDRAVAYIDTMEKVVELAGLKADQLLEADTSLPKEQGGPFIEAKPDALPADRLKANLTTLDARLQHSKALETVMRKLPLTAPLNSFYITSRFGKRRDPINRKWASHYGVDLGDALRSPVYVTAPGVVTYAGWSDKYGRLIEVDHGAGIKTRYGHLHKTMVKKGQKVEFRQKIGLLGNTGRSTGAHLHYEVLFKGKAKNPMKFIQAGRYVFHG